MKNIYILLVFTLAFYTNKKNQPIKTPHNNILLETENQKNYSCEDFSRFFKKVDSITSKNKYIWDKNIYGPVLLIDEKNRKYYANTNPDEEVFSKEHNCYEGTLPKGKIFAGNTTIKWKGKVWATASLPLSTIPGFDIELVTHELTHVVLGARGHSVSAQNTSHLTTQDGRVLIRLEFELLKKFIMEDRKDIQLLKDALSIRLLRYEKFPDYRKNENALEHNEGLANYSGTIMANLTKSKIKSFYTMRINMFVNSKTYGKDFAYIPMVVYGMKLRETDSLWTQKITPKSDLTDFFVKKFNVSKSPENLDFYISKYDFSGIIEKEKNTIIKQQKSIDSISKIFLKAPYFKLKLEKPSMSTSPEDFLLNEKGRHFSTARILDLWGELNTTKGIVISPDFRTAYLRAPQNYSSNNVVGEGYTLKLKKGYKVVMETDSIYILKKEQ